MSERSTFQDALRILFLLVKGSEQMQGLPDGAQGIFRTEMKLHALDFWMRYPDYLANELLDLYDMSGQSKYLEIVNRIFLNAEPDLRKIPMIRFRFGAYERLDNVLSILCSRNLIDITGRKSGIQVQETDFLVMPSAYDLIERIVTEFPILTWYDERASIVVELAGSRGGTALKKHQYDTIQYAETQLGGIIPSLSQQVNDRLTLINKSGRWVS